MAPQTRFSVPAPIPKQISAVSPVQARAGTGLVVRNRERHPPGAHDPEPVGDRTAKVLPMPAPPALRIPARIAECFSQTLPFLPVIIRAIEPAGYGAELRHKLRCGWVRRLKPLDR